MLLKNNVDIDVKDFIVKIFLLTLINIDIN